MSEPICACGHHLADHETVDWDGNGPFCGLCWLDEQYCGEYREVVEVTTRPPRGRAAVNAWSARFLSVMFDPTDENLQRLCTVLDAIDRWVVDGWEKKGHDDRMATLRACRVDARRANRAVREALRAGQAERGRANQAKRSVDK